MERNKPLHDVARYNRFIFMRSNYLENGGVSLMTKDIATVKAALEYFKHRVMVDDWNKPSREQHLEVIKAAARAYVETALSSPPAAPTPYNNGVDIDWDDICFRVAEKLYGHDKNVWSLPYADLNVIRLVQEFIDQQLYERATNPPPPALDKGE